MTAKLSMAQVQRLAEAASDANPLVAQSARDRLAALAEDEARFEDQEAWLWAQHLTRSWTGRSR